MVQSSEHDPLTVFESWLTEAYLQELTDPNAMAIATVSPQGHPSVRNVLLKHWSREEGLIFCTSSNSKKAKHLEQNKHVALLFYWKSLYRQISMEGTVQPTDRETSEHLFAIRPRESQLTTYVSKQSQPMESPLVFDTHLEKARSTLKNDSIPCPEHWSGYQFSPHTIEFWVGQPYRRHQRTLYTKDAHSQQWSQSFLHP
jgi:pyridoxamine 5'-phosphate oxidase